MTSIEDQEYKRNLRRAVLIYFDKPIRSRNMNQHDLLSGFDAKEVKLMMYALDRAGLIAKIQGTGPAAVYVTTDDGILLMQAMDLSEEEWCS